MKDMIKRIRAEREGFTLAELLIVVAIIAVLVAIAIPVFSSQLEKSRESADAANLRAAYAEVVSAALTGDTGTEDQISKKMVTDDGVEVANGIYSKTVTATQTQAGWQNKSIENIGGVAIAKINAVTKGNTWTVSFNSSDNTTTITPTKTGD